MIVVVCSNGNSLESEVSDVFGRCAYFLVVKVEGGEVKDFHPVENVSNERKIGAGISAAKKVGEKGAEKVVAGNVGPRASSVLEQFGIEFHRAQGVVKEALKELL